MSEPTPASISERVARFMGRPSMLIWPLVGVTKPSSIFMVVDLPDPFGPSSPCTVPDLTSKPRLLTTVVPPYVFVRLSVLMIDDVSMHSRFPHHQQVPRRRGA